MDFRPPEPEACALAKTGSMPDSETSVRGIFVKRQPEPGVPSDSHSALACVNHAQLFLADDQMLLQEPLTMSLHQHLQARLLPSTVHLPWQVSRNLQPFHSALTRAPLAEIRRYTNANYERCRCARNTAPHRTIVSHCNTQARRLAPHQTFDERRHTFCQSIRGLWKAGFDAVVAIFGAYDA